MRVLNFYTANKQSMQISSLLKKNISIKNRLGEIVNFSFDKKNQELTIKMTEGSLTKKLKKGETSDQIVGNNVEIFMDIINATQIGFVPKN